jgi:hypothetical protein
MIFVDGKEQMGMFMFYFRVIIIIYNVLNMKVPPKTEVLENRASNNSINSGRYEENRNSQKVKSSRFLASRNRASRWATFAVIRARANQNFMVG